MRSVRLFLVIFAILICFCLLVTLFLPSKVTVSKTIEVNAPGQKIAMQINDFRNWWAWYPAFQNKNIKVQITDTIHFHSATITNEKNKTISFHLLKSVNGNSAVLLTEKGKSAIIYQFVIAPNGNGKTQLTWNVNTTLGWYPWKKIAGIFLDKITGPGYENALQNLKIAAEK